MNWKFFVGACILAAGLLLKSGAPMPAVAMGIGLAAVLNWRKQSGGVPKARKDHPRPE